MQSNSLPEWLLYFQAVSQIVVVPLIGGIGVWITLQQKRLNATKIRLDLYDRRLAVFKQLRDFFGMIVREGRVSKEAIGALAAVLPEADFLFDASVTMFLNRLWDDMMRSYSASRKVDHSPIEMERLSVLAHENAELFSVMLQHGEDLVKIFKPFLQIDPHGSLDPDMSKAWSDWHQMIRKPISSGDSK